MARSRTAPGSTGSVSYTDSRGLTRARARLCLPDLDSRNPATGAYEPGELVFIEAQGADEPSALAALQVVQAARLAKHRHDHDNPAVVPAAEVKAARRVQTVTTAAKAAVAKSLKDKHIGESSAYVYTLHITSHLAGSELGQMALADVRSSHVEDYLTAVAHGTGLATAKAGKAVLNRLFGQARRAELISVNPMSDLDAIRAPKAKPKAKGDPVGLDHSRALDKAERVALAWAVARDDEAKALDVRDVVLAGLALGGRIGELSAIRWADVEFLTDGSGTARVTLAATIDRVTGKGLVRRAPKTAASERTVPVARRIGALLRRRARAAGVDLANIGADERPVFGAPGRWPGQPVAWRDRANTAKVIRAVFDRAGFPWLAMHGLRRTAVTQLADVLPIRQAADFAGHASVRTTLDHYIGRGSVSDKVAGLL